MQSLSGVWSEPSSSVCPRGRGAGCEPPRTAACVGQGLARARVEGLPWIFLHNPAMPAGRCCSVQLQAVDGNAKTDVLAQGPGSQGRSLVSWQGVFSPR